MDFGLIVGSVVVLVIIVLTLISRYRIAKPDEALIISGTGLRGKGVVKGANGNKVKIVVGGGTFVLPVVQQASKLSLLSSQLDISTDGENQTSQGVPIYVDAVAIIKVGGSIEEISTASEQFLSKTREDRERECEMVMAGHLRAIIGKMTVESIFKDKDELANQVQDIAGKDLSKMGIQIVSFTVREIHDDNGYLDSLGKKDIARVRRDAEIAEAEAERETRMKRAEQNQLARNEEIERETVIAEAEKVQSLKVSEYKKEQDKAKADADNAYKLQTAILNREIKEKDMEIEITERNKQIELEAKEIERRENQYNAEVRKKAEAEAYAVEKQADAEKHRQLADAQAKAEAIKLEGKAQATAIKEKGLAEAEAKEKIAKAFYERYGNIALAEMALNALPKMVESGAKAYENIDKISIVDTGNGGKGSGAGKMNGYLTDLLATSVETMDEVAGVKVKDLLHDFAGKKNIKGELTDIATGLGKQGNQELNIVKNELNAKPRKAKKVVEEQDEQDK